MQLTLYHAMPGYLGGCALRDQRGIDYLRKIGALGGQTTVKRYGRERMRELARLSVESRRKKRENDPNTIQFWDGTLRRRIPYKKTNSKARRVQYVQILLDDGGIGVI